MANLEITSNYIVERLNSLKRFGSNIELN